jgi:DNA-binding NarL/FixJ family response regulator
VRETLEVLVTGASDKEIAKRLGISLHTVHQYVKVLLRAYHVESRVQLAARLLGGCHCGGKVAITRGRTWIF